MEGERRFCTYPGSLPPHSIIRQSIMSTKKEEKKQIDSHDWLQECGCSSPLLLSQPDICWFCAWLILSGKKGLIFPKQPVQR